MKRRIPRTPGSLPAPVSPRPGAIDSTPLPGQAHDVDAHSRLVRQLDVAIILTDLL